MQRVWISLEAKKLAYQYIEVDPYKKPKELLDVNPRGLVPGLKHGNWALPESTVIMEYVRISANVSEKSSIYLIQSTARGFEPRTRPPPRRSQDARPLTSLDRPHQPQHRPLFLPLPSSARRIEAGLQRQDPRGPHRHSRRRCRRRRSLLPGSQHDVC